VIKTLALLQYMLDPHRESETKWEVLEWCNRDRGFYCTILFRLLGFKPRICSSWLRNIYLPFNWPQNHSDL